MCGAGTHRRIPENQYGAARHVITNPETKAQSLSFDYQAVGTIIA
jgi:hypothetical protein